MPYQTTAFSMWMQLEILPYQLDVLLSLSPILEPDLLSDRAFYKVINRQQNFRASSLP